MHLTPHICTGFAVNRTGWVVFFMLFRSEDGEIKSDNWSFSVLYHNVAYLNRLSAIP